MVVFVTISPHLSSCGVTPSTSGGLIYTLSNFIGEVKLSTCNDQTTFDSLIQVFQDTVAGSCVAGNDDGDNWAYDCMGQFGENGSSDCRLSRDSEDDNKDDSKDNSYDGEDVKDRLCKEGNFTWRTTICIMLRVTYAR